MNPFFMTGFNPHAQEIWLNMYYTCTGLANFFFDFDNLSGQKICLK